MSLPVDMLVNEHKLIIQATEVIKKKMDIIKTSQNVDPNNITAMVDFFRVYADKFHHGKEEGILFRELYQKKMIETDTKIVKDLMQEHAFARKTVSALEKAKDSYVLGKKEALKEMLEILSTLSIFYPMHIEKEDKHFFYPCMEYLSPEERKQMMNQFQQFNSNFTDNRYMQVVKSL